jgi:E3 SUMO-protein ligase NSE2
MQQSEAAEAEESSEDEAVQAPRGSARQVNGSNSSRLQVPSTQQPPRSSIIEDLGDPSDDESISQQPPVGTMVEDLGDPSGSEAEL